MTTLAAARIPGWGSTRRHLIKRGAAVVIVLAVMGLTTACSDFGFLCALRHHQGVELHVRDAVKDQPFPLGSVAGIAYNGTLEQQLEEGPPSTLRGLHGKPGVYLVTVVAAGYKPWTSAVTIGEDCHGAFLVKRNVNLVPL